MASRSFRDVVAWQKAHAWVLAIYRLTGRFPREELFGLTSRLRRAAVSVAANIVEGFGRRSRQEKTRFYNIAHASLDEATYYLILAQDLKYADTEQTAMQAEEVGRILSAYSDAVQTAIA